jgi:L-alanine-DL-glutamate epimerase-like enolase superfamily enzyme
MKMTWRRQRIHTRHPFKIARAGASLEGTETDRVIVHIEDRGIVGWGEAAPSPYYNQTCASVDAALSQAAAVLGGEPLQVVPIMDRLLERFSDQSAAVAAIDMALRDWVGKKVGLPLWRVLGLDITTTPFTSYTIGITEREHLPARVAEAAGYRAIKVKVGTDDDADILSVIRKHAPKQFIRVDANGGWSPDDALERIKDLSRFNLELVEQPIKAGQLEALSEIHARSPVPIFADEDCVRLADVPRLVGVVDGINIKLAKCGGIGEAYTMMRVAKRLGLKVMMGCMIETSLGVCAAAQIASLADYVDLESHLLLADDPYDGLTLGDGVVKPSHRAGLGVTTRSSR